MPAVVVAGVPAVVVAGVPAVVVAGVPAVVVAGVLAVVAAGVADLVFEVVIVVIAEAVVVAMLATAARMICECSWLAWFDCAWLRASALPAENTEVKSSASIGGNCGRATGTSTRCPMPAPANAAATFVDAPPCCRPLLAKAFIKAWVAFGSRRTGAAMDSPAEPTKTAKPGRESTTSLARLRTVICP